MEGLAGRRVLITGASTGIGAAAADAFARHGARVAIHYFHNEREAQAVADRIGGRGGSAILIRGDLTVRGEAKRVVVEAAEQLGGLDTLVNNAGSLVRRTPFTDLDDDLIDQVFDLNVRAVIAACQAAIPYLERQPDAAIINVGSIAGSNGGGPGSAMYASSKAFIHNLTRHLARDLGPEGSGSMRYRRASSIRHSTPRLRRR